MPLLMVKIVVVWQWLIVVIGNGPERLVSLAVVLVGVVYAEEDSVTLTKCRC